MLGKEALEPSTSRRKSVTTWQNLVNSGSAMHFLYPAKLLQEKRARSTMMNIHCWLAGALLLAQLACSAATLCEVYVNMSYPFSNGTGTPQDPFRNMVLALNYVHFFAKVSLTQQTNSGNFSECTISIAPGRYSLDDPLNFECDREAFSLTLSPWADEPGSYYTIPQMSLSNFKGTFCSWVWCAENAPGKHIIGG